LVGIIAIGNSSPAREQIGIPSPTKPPWFFAQHQCFPLAAMPRAEKLYARFLLTSSTIASGAQRPIPVEEWAAALCQVPE